MSAANLPENFHLMRREADDFLRDFFGCWYHEITTDSTTHLAERFSHLEDSVLRESLVHILKAASSDIHTLSAPNFSEEYAADKAKIVGVREESEARNIANDKKIIWNIVMVLAIIGGFANIIFSIFAHHHGLDRESLVFLWVMTVFVNIGLYILGVPVYAYFNMHRHSRFWTNRRCRSPQEAFTYHQLDRSVEVIRSISFTWPALNYATLTAFSMSLRFLA